ncbi:MAG: type II toxin-antitoxin system VapC family toxin [Spirochaetaceae bacterium]|nr:type II toxin-antitoxin system VapC family toxin [Spirochaetaceae bacterium]
MAFVVDSSFVGAIIIPDERNPAVDKMKAGIGENDDVFVPHLFWYEMANIFMNIIRRKRYAVTEVKQFFPLVAALRLTDDFETGTGYSMRLLRLCNDFNLSSYDAAYLELARRKKAVLCTLDDGLRKAAKKYGVALMSAK